MDARPVDNLYWLRVRLDELDEAMARSVAADTSTVLSNFVVVMSSWTSTRVIDVGSRSVTVDPAGADQLVSTSRLLERLNDDVPEIVRAPLCRDRQQWIGVTRPKGSDSEAGSHDAPKLTRELFRAPTGSGRLSHRQPYQVGLYTSTLTSMGQSTWRLFLELGSEASLHPRPWSVWRVLPAADSRIAEVNSAEAWLGFLNENGSIVGETVYPDWVSAACKYEGVHFTLSAIVAIQGFTFRLGEWLAAPVYWDVETTLWLNWTFDSATLEAIVD